MSACLVVGAGHHQRAQGAQRERGVLFALPWLLGGIDVGPLVTAIENGSAVTTGERVSARAVLDAVPEVPAIAHVQQRLGAKSDGQRAAAVELALEALYLAKRIDKVSGEGETVYG